MVCGRKIYVISGTTARSPGTNERYASAMGTSTDNNDTEMTEEYLDCTGKRRTFRLAEIAGGLFIHAHEVPKTDRAGLRFVVAARAGELPPWGEIRSRIRTRLAQRSLVHGPDGLELLTDVIRGQIAESEDKEDESVSVVIDDLELSWAALGRLLRSHVGFGFRLEIHGAGEE